MGKQISIELEETPAATYTLSFSFRHLRRERAHHLGQGCVGSEKDPWRSHGVAGSGAELKLGVELKSDVTTC